MGVLDPLNTGRISFEDFYSGFFAHFSADQPTPVLTRAATRELRSRASRLSCPPLQLPEQVSSESVSAARPAGPLPSAERAGRS